MERVMKFWSGLKELMEEILKFKRESRKSIEEVLKFWKLNEVIERSSKKFCSGLNEKSQ